MGNQLTILLGFILLFLGCESDNGLEQQAIEPIVVGQGNLYGNGLEGISKQNLVIKDETSWNSLLTRMNVANNESDDFSETDIDFSTYEVIAIFDQIRGNSGNSLEITVTQTNDKRIVEVAYHVSDFGGRVITQPYLIARIPISELPIEFQ